ncbi:MAG TPA: NAD-dependent epimerase/dehydratase family protein, partial [Gammaproteobacteria bacterium]|nr:NAD-dependent epimerase/dehydratase family protein [Gammaproteobacteria bacterium]
MTTRAFFDPFGAFAREEVTSTPRSTERSPHSYPALRSARSRANAKRILVTGATGFIGTKLVHRLIERGDDVLVLARNPAKAADLFGPCAEVVTSLRSVATATRIDAIVNLAGESIAGG